jgi:hypothetical protein
MCLFSKYHMVAMNQDQIILALKINISNGDNKISQFYACFSFKELKMQVLKFMSNYPTSCTLGRNGDSHRNWRRGFRL